jgi:L-fuconolactonase
MPDFPIVDSHVHLWDPGHFRMEWLDGNQTLGTPFDLAAYREHTAGIDVEAMVYLEVDLAKEYKLLEPQWVIERAQEDARIRGIVASAPLEFGEQVRAFLEALVALNQPGKHLIKGVRRLLQGEPDPAFCLQPRFVRGVQLLAEYDLSFDICVYYIQLGNAVELARRCPDTQLILDHIGKPNIRGKELDPWRQQIKDLAALPNVICKMSGVLTEADLQHWTIDDVRPYVEHILESFGEDRVAYGGDWPVVLNAASYRQWVDTLDQLTQHLSPAAKRKLWAENARRFYCL